MTAGTASGPSSMSRCATIASSGRSSSPSVTSSEHPLPAAIRQNVANLGLFVMNQTVTIMHKPKREQLHSLININRELAAGLLGRA